LILSLVNLKLKASICPVAKLIHIPAFPEVLMFPLESIRPLVNQFPEAITPAPPLKIIRPLLEVPIKAVPSILKPKD
jgi:hypothetical protein